MLGTRLLAGSEGYVTVSNSLGCPMGWVEAQGLGLKVETIIGLCEGFRHHDGKPHVDRSSQGMSDCRS